MTSFALVDGTNLMVDSDGNVYGPRGLRKQTPGSNGYLGTSYTGDGRKETHRMVAEAFCPRPPGEQEVAHGDGIKAHCAAHNLRWVPRVTNHADRWLHRTWGTKLTIEDVREVRLMLAAGEPQRYIAACFKVTTTTVRHIMQGHTWKGRE